MTEQEWRGSIDRRGMAEVRPSRVERETGRSGGLCQIAHIAEAIKESANAYRLYTPIKYADQTFHRRASDAQNILDSK